MLRKRTFIQIIFIFIIVAVLVGCGKSRAVHTSLSSDYENAYSVERTSEALPVTKESYSGETYTLETLPEFSDSPFVVLNDNTPSLDETVDIETFDNFAPLDRLGRCGVASMLIGVETMPTEERGKIGSVKPSGWHSVKYGIVDGKYLYNRCHLIGFQLSGENANELNLITGTRYMNTQGMLPFENAAADYIRETGNHILYRVTPIFKGNNLVADGVEMEAFSYEDGGSGLCFDIFAYNAQPGIVIDYATGDSSKGDDYDEVGARIDSGDGYDYKKYDSEKADLNDYGAIGTGGIEKAKSGEEVTYVVNTNTGKFHYPDCDSVGDMSKKNRLNVSEDREKLIQAGYKPCGRCKP